MVTPYDWQLRDLETLKENNYTGLLAISPGGGKTALSCMVINDLDPEVTLIVAPLSTISSPNRNWPREVREICDREVRLIGNKNEAQREALIDFELGTPGVYATTPQFASRKTTDTSMWFGDLLVWDELHMGSTPKTTTQRAFSGFYPSDKPLNRQFTHRLGLSGTYYRQDFSNAWSTMRFLWPELDGRNQIADDNFWAWQNHRMTSEQVYTSQRDQFGNAKKVTNFITEREPGRLLSEMPCAIVHKRRERCCEYHPEGFLTTDEPQIIERVVDLTKVQKQAVAELETHYMTFLEENPLITELSITQQQRIRQICLGEPVVEYYWGEDRDGHPVEKSTLQFEEDCASPFLDETLHILDNLPDKEPVVVFLDAQRFAPVIVKRLRDAGYTAEEYSGVTKANLDGFGSEYQVLVAITSAFGVGTDGAQKKCNTEIVMEIPVSLTNESQRSARLDRLGGKQVQCYVLKDSEGYAEGRLSANLTKRLMINATMRRTG